MWKGVSCKTWEAKIADKVADMGADRAADLGADKAADLDCALIFFLSSNSSCVQVLQTWIEIKKFATQQQGTWQARENLEGLKKKKKKKKKKIQCVFHQEVENRIASSLSS